MKMRRGLLYALCSAALMCSLYPATASADVVTGTLFYTTFAGGVNVHSVDFNFNGTSFLLSNNHGIASTSGADGLLFAPDGNLLVAGQGNNLTEVTPGGTIVKTIAPGGGSFHLALTSSAPNALVYNLNNGGCGNNCISAVTLSSGGLSLNGVLYTTIPCAGCSADVRGVILNTNNNTWYYGTAPDGGSGEFGTVVFNDTLHTATLTRLKTGLFAHGLTFDPFTNDVIVNSAGTVQQLDAAGNILSSFTAAGNTFDQGAADGKGHLFVASNNGNLLFIDYDATGLIGAGSNFTNTQFLAGALDDIAPLSGLGGGTGPSVPGPSSLLLLGGGLATAALVRYRRARAL
jgi:hypothetical protein